MTPTKRHLRLDFEVYPQRGRDKDFGFWFSNDLSKWFGGKMSTAERSRDYKRRKKLGIPIKTRKHSRL